MGTTEWQLTVQVVQAVVVLGALIIAIRAFLETKLAAQTAARTYVRSALKEGVLRELTERPFKTRPKAEIPGTLQPVEDLRTAKIVARKEVQRDFAAWSEASQIDKLENWQNHVAFETAEGLQQLGLAAFTGSIPLQAALANVGDVVIDDWLICSSWIKSYQTRQEKVFKVVDNDSDGEVHYHRRHAEWIFLVALAWMRKEGWNYPDLYKKIPVIPTPDNCEKRLRILTKADGSLLPDSVRREVRMLTSVSI